MLPTSNYFFRTAILTMIASWGIAAGLIELFPAHAFGESWAMWKHAWTQADEESADDPEVVLLGDSRLKTAIVVSELGPCVTSLTVPGTGPLETYFLLEHYLKHHPAPKVIVVSMAPVHFHSANLFWEQTARFGFVTPDDMHDVVHEAHRVGEARLAPPWRLSWDIALHHYHAPHLYLPAIASMLTFRHHRNNVELIDRLAASHGHYYIHGFQPRDGGSFETAYRTFDPLPVQTAYFDRLLDLAVSSGAKTIVATMPVPEHSAALLTEEYRTAWQDFLGTASRRHPRVVFDEPFRYRQVDDFYDANHVNEQGAQKETQRLRPWLESTCVDARTDTATPARSE